MFGAEQRCGRGRQLLGERFGGNLRRRFFLRLGGRFHGNHGGEFGRRCRRFRRSGLDRCRLRRRLRNWPCNRHCAWLRRFHPVGDQRDVQFVPFAPRHITRKRRRRLPPGRRCAKQLREPLHFLLLGVMPHPNACDPQGRQQRLQRRHLGLVGVGVVESRAQRPLHHGDVQRAVLRGAARRPQRRLLGGSIHFVTRVQRHQVRQLRGELDVAVHFRPWGARCLAFNPAPA